ncbi:MAG: ABC transporter permease [Hyphomicrobiaceae bacterium]
MTPIESIAVGRRPSARWRLPLPLALAWRELRGGLGGFYVFIACVALGVTVIAAVGALSDGLRAGFERQGERILGGDVTLARVHKRAEPAELTWLAARGRLSETATLRAMARTKDGQDQTLVELKPVDRAYPLAGAITLRGGATLDATVRGGLGAAVEPILLDRLNIKIGDTIRLGELELPVTAVIESEPDSISDRMTFGPRIMVSHETMEKTGLVQPGTLIRWRYAIKLQDAGVGAAALTAFRDQLSKGLPESGFVVADRRDPSPRVTQTLDRLRQFLTLIGLTALMVGGVGVANAVATFIDRRRKVIATMKSLGATGRMIFAVFLSQVLLIAGLGVAIGLVLGNLVPIVLDALYGSALPVRAELTFSLRTVTAAALYGFLVAFVFTLWPLGRAGVVRAGVLFRDEVSADRALPPRAVIVASVVAGLALVAFAVLSSESDKLAFYFCLGLVAIFAVFLGLGWLVTRLARRAPRSRMPEWSLAIGNIGGPEGLTRSVVLSLGVGLSLLVAVALAHAAMVEELSARLPKQSPNYFVLDITRKDEATFDAAVKKVVPEAIVHKAPMLRGRIVRIKDQPVDQIKLPPEAQWVLNGDRGLTYADAVPQGSKLVAGDWWAADYAGEPLVSFETELAKHLRLGIGDTITVNVLGRNVTARIANLREVQWESLAINFVMVFSPNTLRSAPHNLLATVTFPADTPIAVEAQVAREMGQVLPAVTAIRVKDALDAFNAVFAKVMVAVRAAAAVTLIAGALVLAGALATAQRRRIQQAVILKVVGATRRRILLTHAIEYGLLAGATALFAVLLGSLAAWIVVTRVMELDFVFSFSAVAQALGIAISLVMLFGGVGTWQVLKSPAVPYLRSE